MNKKYNKKGGSMPYILEIKKINNNKRLIDEPESVRMSSKLELSPLSGSEHAYNPRKWNDKSDIKYTHNCYTYAMGKIVPKLSSKAQPGYASGYNHIDDNDYKCKEFYQRLRKDNPGSYIEKFDESCIPGFYKVFLALDEGNDYHWWRQDSNQLWSHKPGSTEVVNKDASGKLIKNPYKANRNYESLNYKTPCFYACVNSDLSRAIADIYDKKSSYF